MSTPSRPYVANGQVLQSPPLAARFRYFMNDAYLFLGLYLTTLFSFDAYGAAEQSSFSLTNRTPGSRTSRGGWGGWGGSGGSGGGDGGGPGNGGSGGRPSGGRKLGTVDDVRGPECKSCG